MPLQLYGEVLPLSHPHGDLARRLAQSTPPSAAAIRSSVERGDPFAYVRNAPVGLGVNPGERIGAAVASLLAARADEAVTDDPHGPHVQQVGVLADPDGHDADTVEHTRQSRLSRWQRLP